jgi:hypothetical protein
MTPKSPSGMVAMVVTTLLALVEMMMEPAVLVSPLTLL